MEIGTKLKCTNAKNYGVDEDYARALEKDLWVCVYVCNETTALIKGLETKDFFLVCKVDDNKWSETGTETSFDFEEIKD